MNTETTYDQEFGVNPQNLSVKLFSEMCCTDCSCQYESTPMPVTDNMGREIFWEDLGRPN